MRSLWTIRRQGQERFEAQRGGGARIYYCVSDVTVTDQEKFPQSKRATKCSYILRFLEADRGKQVYFTLKWEIRKENGESPGGEIRSGMVPQAL
jgi:hypothetical protein